MIHRRHTPVIMLSATVDDAAARIAGADVGLHKPEAIGSLDDTIAQLLKFERSAGRSFVSESN